MDMKAGTFFIRNTESTAAIVHSFARTGNYTAAGVVKGSELIGTNVTGTNATMTIQPQDSGQGRDLILRGNKDTNSLGGGNVRIGDIERQRLLFYTRLTDGYRFHKPGVTNVSGRLDFSLIGANRTYKYPNFGGGVVIGTNVADGTVRKNGEIEADAFYGRGTLRAAARIRNGGSTASTKRLYNIDLVSFTGTNSSSEDVDRNIQVFYSKTAPEGFTINLAHAALCQSNDYPGAYMAGPDGAGTGDSSTSAGYAFFSTIIDAGSQPIPINGSILDQISIMIFDVTAPSSTGLYEVSF